MVVGPRRSTGPVTIGPYPRVYRWRRWQDERSSGRGLMLSPRPRQHRSDVRGAPECQCSHGRAAMKTLYRRVAGIDVQRVKHVATILIEREDGTEQHTREFGGFKRDLRWLVARSQ